MVTQNMFRTHERKWSFFEKKKRFLIALYLSKCLKQIKSAYTRASLSELPSNITTMIPPKVNT